MTDNIKQINGNRISYTIDKGDNLTKIAKANNTTIDAILKLNPNIKNPNVIYAGKTLIITNNKPFIQKEDYSPNNMNLGEVRINDENIKKIDDKEIKSNFFANNLGKLSSQTINDNNPTTKIVIELQAGKSMTRKDNDTPYSILNKVVADHINNESIITKDENNNLKIKNQWLENTDLYKAFISEDVNGDNFSGENNKLIPRGESGNHVQIPSLEIDKNGKKYFTLHGNEKILFFDEKGQKVDFENGTIINTQNENQIEKNIKLPMDYQNISKIPNEEFLIREDNNDKALNIGKFYVNGEKVEISNVKSNFFANNINQFMEKTLNDDTSSSRLDIQLNIGSQIDTRDTKADDILKKILGNNYNKTSTVKENSGKFEIINTAITETDLYKAFISKDVNGNNFENGKITRNHDNFNLVQFPALEIDENNNKYYTLHTNDNKVLFFDSQGKQINK